MATDPNALPGTTYISSPTQQFPQASAPVVNQQVVSSPAPVQTFANNTVSPDSVSGRDALITPFQMNSPATTIFNTPNATYGQYYGSMAAPNQAALTTNNNAASMLGSQVIMPPVPTAQLPSNTVAGIIGSLGALAPIAAGAAGSLTGGGSSATATATGGNSTATGGQGGSSNVGPITVNEPSYNYDAVPGEAYLGPGTSTSPYTTAELDQILGVGGGINYTTPYSIPAPVSGSPGISTPLQLPDGTQSNPQLYGPLGPTAQQYGDAQGGTGAMGGPQAGSLGPYAGVANLYGIGSTNPTQGLYNGSGNLNSIPAGQLLPGMQPFTDTTPAQNAAAAAAASSGSQPGASAIWNALTDPYYGTLIPFDGLSSDMTSGGFAGAASGDE
jgi:hypothetical protein